MNISRRDTIMIAVLMNVGLLAILFLTAVYEEGSAPHIVRQEETVPLTESIPLTQEKVIVLDVVNSPVDEVDVALQSFSEQAVNKVVQLEEVIEEVVMETPEPTPVELPRSPDPGVIQITVKRGDALEKIARANGTTVSTLRRMNNLSTDFLRIGQVLLVPLSDSVPQKPTQQTQIAMSDDAAVWYTVQSGDNPWKVARKFHVKYFDILRLNQLDEEKARKLRPGDKIRVK